MNKNPKIFLFIFLSFISLFPNFISSDNLLKFNPKTDCPNPKISSLGILISLSENEESSSEKSQISQEEREAYEEIIKLKRSFSSTMSYIPQNFTPEKPKYWEELDFLLIIFVVIALFPFIFICLYLMLRFVCKKCTGPKKLKQVTKIYRNVTWFIMITFTIISLILFSIVLSKSQSVRDNVNNSFKYTALDFQEGIENLNNTVKFFEKNNPQYPLPLYDYIDDFGKEIKSNLDDTVERSDDIIEKEDKRANIVIAIYVVYFCVVFASYIVFFLKRENYEIFLSIVLFFAVPGLIILEGYNARFFFYYSDICDSINSAIYSNEFPVAGQSLGYYYNCFPTKTKASWYNIKYKLYQNINNNDELQQSYDNITTSEFAQLFDCKIVNEFLPKIEKNFCKDSLDHMYSIVSLMTWLLLTALGVAIGVRRLQVLIWKKKMEIEEMIENKEAIF